MRLLTVLKNNKGFSLVEILVFMVIMLLIAISFTPLLLRSIETIYYAGDKSEALHQSQSEMEVSIVERKTYEGHELEFNFGEDVTIEVPGGLLDVEEFAGSAEAWLSSFIPFVPTIKLFSEPLPLIEGYSQFDLYVLGTDTDISNNDHVTIYDSNDSILSDIYYGNLILTSSDDDPSIPAGYDQYVKIRLYEGLTNAGSPYIFELTYDHEETGATIKVRARLQVELPYAVAVGSGRSMWLSPDAGETWRGKNNDQIPGGLGTINQVIWNGFEYIAVCDDGSIITWANREEITRTHSSSGVFYDLVNRSGLLVAVGEHGKVYTSNNSRDWSKHPYSDENGSTLRMAAWNESELLVAGDNGTIVKLNSDQSWEEQALAEIICADTDETKDFSSVSFRSGAYGKGKWVLVGRDGNNTDSAEGVIFTRNSGSEWEKLVDYSGPILNDVIFDGDRFIAVGKNGNIKQSSDGISWTPVLNAADNNYTDKELRSITYSDIRGHGLELDGDNGVAVYDLYLAVGSEGTILISQDGLNWASPFDGNGNKPDHTIHFSGVAIR